MVQGTRTARPTAPSPPGAQLPHPSPPAAGRGALRSPVPLSTARVSRSARLRSAARDWLTLPSITRRGGAGGRATRGVRHRPATPGTALTAGPGQARPGVMAAAAAPSPLQAGDRAPGAGADLAASEVASSALRSLVGLAGQVSAGRAGGSPGAESFGVWRTASPVRSWVLPSSGLLKMEHSELKCCQRVIVV